MKTEKPANGSLSRLSVVVSIAAVLLAPVISVYASISVMDERLNSIQKDIRILREAVLENQRDLKHHLQYHLDRRNGKR